MMRSLSSSRWIVAGCSVSMLCAALATAQTRGGEEPADVLDRQAALVARGSPATLARQPDELNQEISGWRALVDTYPSSDLALVTLAMLESLKADVSGDTRALPGSRRHVHPRGGSRARARRTAVHAGNLEGPRSRERRRPSAAGVWAHPSSRADDGTGRLRGRADRLRRWARSPRSS